jgi:hypothetical protein
MEPAPSDYRRDLGLGFGNPFQLFQVSVATLLYSIIVTRNATIGADAEVPMMAFLLLVTWLGYAQPPSHYQVEFSSNEACEAARLQLIKDAERIGQSMIERATAQDRQIGGNNKTALLMAAISNAPYVSAVCVQTSAS